MGPIVQRLQEQLGIHIHALPFYLCTTSNNGDKPSTHYAFWGCKLPSVDGCGLELDQPIEQHGYVVGIQKLLHGCLAGVHTGDCNHDMEDGARIRVGDVRHTCEACGHCLPLPCAHTEATVAGV